MGVKKYFTRENILLAGLLVIIFIVGFSVTYFTLKFSKIFVKSPVSTPAPVSFSKATPEPLNNPKGVYNILFLGYGGEGHAGSLLTDSIIIVHVDTNTHKSALVSVPRDLWLPANRKINAEGSVNGFGNVGSAVQSVTGMHIDYFVSVDFGGFSKIIDDLGGITVDVPKTFDDPFYPITGLENETCGKTIDEITALKAKYSDYNLETQFTCRYEHLHFDQGATNLDGVASLKFVRSRHGDSDFGRSERQFAVLTGIENKLISAKSLGKLDSTIDTLSKIVKTNISAGAIKSLITAFGDPGAYKLTQVHLTTDNVLSEGKSSAGAYILYPKAGINNFSGIKSYISSQL